MFNRNANVVLYTLTLLEAMVKNCGGPVQSEIATKAFMDQFRRLIRGSIASVKPRCLELIQTWAYAFEGQPRYKIVPDTYNVLRMEGHIFPEHNPHGDAMFVAEVAPEWADGNECFSCRCRFSLTNRKHHCRKCGQIFCGKCSSKQAAIPKFGIVKPVRVCDFCFGQLEGTIPESAPAPLPSATGSSLSSNGPGTVELSPEEEVRRFVERERAMQAQSPSSSGPSDKERRDAELKEKEEMEMAIALSMSEAEAAKSRSVTSDYSAYQSASAPDPSPLPSGPQGGLYGAQLEEADAMAQADDPMASYLGHSSATFETSASPSGEDISVVDQVVPLSKPEDVRLLSALRPGLDLFEQKLARAQQRGTGVRNDRALVQMSRSLSLMQPELIGRIDEIENEKSDFVALQEKIAQIRTTWMQLEDLKREQIRRAEEQRREQEVLQRLQLEQKMKLIERQEAEKQEYMRAMEERIRIQEMEQRRQDEERRLAAQQQEMERQQAKLAEQQESLRLRRAEAAALRSNQNFGDMQRGYQQPGPPQSDAMRIHRMHAAAEADRSQRIKNGDAMYAGGHSGKGVGPGMPPPALKPPQPNVVPASGPSSFSGMPQHGVAPSMPPPGALKPPQPNVAPAAGTPSFNGMPQHSSPQYSMQSPRGPVPHPHLSGNFSPTGPPTTSREAPIQHRPPVGQPHFAASPYDGMQGNGPPPPHQQHFQQPSDRAQPPPAAPPQVSGPLIEL